MTNKSTSLQFNCGFARCAIRELTTKDVNARTDTHKRALDFQKMFENCLNYGVSQPYFTQSAGRQSRFDHHCKTILQSWSKKWHPPESREEYEKTFSVSSWKSLSEIDQQKHTLASCQECCDRYQELQQKFPLKPYYSNEPLVSVNLGTLEKLGKEEGTQSVLSELNTSFTETFQTNFVDNLVKHGGQRLQVKPTRTEQKRKLRKIYRNCRDKENKALKEGIPSSVLCEDESIRGYQRKRLLNHFETPPPKRTCTASNKSHSPDFSNVAWDKEQVLHDLQQHPPAPPAIEWEKFAREHNIPGPNAGQVAKQFAIQSNVDTVRLDGRELTTRVRMRKRRLHGGEISAPSYPTVNTIKKSWQNMVESGTLSLGVPCAPYTVAHYTINAGQVERKETVVIGRKFPLSELREKLLSAQEKYMRLDSDEEIAAMSTSTLQSKLATLHEDYTKFSSVEELQQEYKQLQRTRTLAVWHDHSTLLGLGTVMITVHVVFDPAVFYTQSELNNSKIDIQATVERPIIHMIAAGSSSVEDQAAILQDRIDCLHTLSETVTTSSGIAITDKLRFFVGDHPAQQFERGTQMGGTYKCGGCGVKDIMMDDLAHTLQLPWRSLEELQQVAIAGKFGKKMGDLKPFCKLRIQSLKEELNTREVFYTATLKDDLDHILTGILKGVQHVPTLLLLNPTGSLSDLNLRHYTVLDCEPLHDLKGHLINLCKELPFLLTGEIRKAVEDIIKTTVSDTMTCADHRIVLIQLYLYLRSQDVCKKMHCLLETAVRISQILYLPAQDRTPLKILQFYNCTWLHHELCRELFTRFHAGMTKERFFGHYLHAIVAHAPTQLEIVSLSSVNTENQERIFSQARKTATATSNRHPQNVISTLTLRLQAKTELRDVTKEVKKSESRVSKASKSIQKYKGTKVDTSFVEKRLKSWNQHLIRISPFLVLGKGEWWESILGGYRFCDGDDEYDNQTGPQLLHYRSATLKDVSTRQSLCWEKLMKEKTELPTPKVFLYTPDGIPSGNLTNPQSVQLEDSDNVEVEARNDSEAQLDQEQDQEQDQVQNQEHTCNKDPDSEIESVPESAHVHVIQQEDASQLSLEPEVTVADDVAHFRTKHAAYIAKVLGKTEKVVEFDDLRHELKTSGKKPTITQRQRHENLLADLQTSIQNEKTKIMQQVTQTEKAYFRAHNTLPTLNACPEKAELIKKLKFVNKLLATWRIHL